MLPLLALLLAPTFHKDVEPILQRRCQSCHRAGEIAPMSLVTYAQTRPWAKAIREAVKLRKMPPWFADPRFGQFANDPSLTPAELATIDAWVMAGAPEGPAGDAPPHVSWPSGWTIREPDLVLSMPKPFPVPARSAIDYQYLILPTGFDTDRWIEAVEVRPTDRSIVHHAVLYVREPGDPWLRDFPAGVTLAPPGGPEARRRAGQTTSDILALYTPGAGPYTCPPGMARKIPSGSDLVLQIHYTSKAADALDQMRIGLLFAPEPPAKRVLTLQMGKDQLDIPPGERDVRYSVSGTMPNDAILLSLFPHMHLRGSAFEFEIEGEPLLFVKPYDFYWQLRYELKTPRLLRAGTRLRWTGHFDNSPANPRNPDPAVEVHWGEQSTDEMMIGFFDVAVDPAIDKPRLFNRDTVRGMFQSGVIAVAFLSLLLAGAVNLSGAPEPVLRAIPGKLAWRNPPAAWDIRDGETLTIKAARMTDWFIDPFDGRTIANSPMLLFPAAKDFVLSAKVTVDFRSKWDAGALVLLAGDTLWAKFAFELSADGHPTLVSVVTRGISDDCNSFSITEHSVYLQMARSGQAIVLYASTDGSSWKILRSFSLGPTAEVRIGFSSQSPAGEGLTSAFSDIKYSEKRIANIYTGN